jgi:hypothetical protein
LVPQSETRKLFLLSFSFLQLSHIRILTDMNIFHSTVANA